MTYNLSNDIGGLCETDSMYELTTASLLRQKIEEKSKDLVKGILFYWCSFLRILVFRFGVETLAE